jgi:hypothetical protein
VRVPVPSKPRVLAFADIRTSLVAQARLHTSLRVLHDQGFIADYVVSDATLRGAPRDGRFDVIWLQRAADPWLVRTLASRLRGRYLLDLDDHLLCRPAYLSDADLPPAAAVVAALEGCRVLVAPSARLVGLLEGRSQIVLTPRAHVCPNALPFGDLISRRPGRPAALLLTQSHALALTQSRAGILAAAAEASARHRLPLWVLGAVPRDLQAAATSAGATLQAVRRRSWDEYHRTLAGQPTLVGLAPLETRGDPATVEFVSGKSDVKMVEFGGLGHPAVYSDAAPYVDTDLACGTVTPNDPVSWGAAIDGLVEGGWETAAEEAQVVRELRDLRRVAAECWWPAVRAARLQDPIDAGRLLNELDRARALARDRVARVRWRLRHRD